MMRLADQTSHSFLTPADMAGLALGRRACA